jgi:propanol-preferring alcohol dehydrogenase
VVTKVLNPSCDVPNTHQANPTPLIGIGKIIAHGPGVTSPPIGTVVGIKYAADACLHCGICLEGGETSCPEARVSGFYTPGTFQQYLISWAKYVTVIPKEITDIAAAAPLMCAGITLYAALKRGGVKHNDWVVISGGGGGLGHLGIQYAKAMGAKVLAIDAADKEDFCRSLGADVYLDFRKYPEASELTTAIHEATGGGARLALMCVSNQSAYDQAMSWLGFRGKLAILGVPEGDVKPIAGAVAGLMIGNETSIYALKTGNRLEAKEALDIVAAGHVTPHYELRPMDQLTQIFDDMHAGKVMGRLVIDLR